MTSVRIAYGLLLGLGVAGFLIWFLINGILIPDLQPLASDSDVYGFAVFLLGMIVPFILIMSVFWYVRSIKEYQYFSNNQRRF